MTPYTIAIVCVKRVILYWANSYREMKYEIRKPSKTCHVII